MYIIAIIALGTAAYFIYVHAPRLESGPITPDTTTEQTDAGTERSIQEDTADYSIDVTYRHLGIPSVDAQIDARVADAVAAFKNDATQAGPHEDGFPPYTFGGEAADTFTGGDIVSERVNLYQYTGGAHGLPIVLTFNYHAGTGKEVTLDEALALTGLTLGEVSDRALAQLAQEYGESVFTDGAKPRAENYSTFIVSPYKVTFIFQAYQVVAYAAGMPEISFARK